MTDYKKHIINQKANVLEALAKLDVLAIDAIIFAVDNEGKLVGSLTDGDVRRGLLKGLGLDSNVSQFIQNNPRFFRYNEYTMQQVIEYRSKGFRVVPILDKDNCILNVINFRFHKSYLPVEAIIMAGGRGERLRPLTDNTPKPMLKIGDKPIIEHTVDRLISFGIDDIWISVRYLGEQIEDHFKDGSAKGVKVRYIKESTPLGTIGAVANVEVNGDAYVLISNSDILTNIDYEEFFLDFIEKDAALSVVSIPYNVDIPYAVLETTKENILSFKEKPTYTYYSNGGIYLLKKECLSHIPKDCFFNATDLIELLIARGERVISYPLRGYWLDIGRHEDFKKAQEDIKHIKF